MTEVRFFDNSSLPNLKAIDWVLAEPSALPRTEETVFMLDTIYKVNGVTHNYMKNGATVVMVFVTQLKGPEAQPFLKLVK